MVLPDIYVLSSYWELRVEAHKEAGSGPFVRTIGVARLVETFSGVMCRLLFGDGKEEEGVFAYRLLGEHHNLTFGTFFLHCAVPLCTEGRDGGCAQRNAAANGEARRPSAVSFFKARQGEAEGAGEPGGDAVWKDRQKGWRESGRETSTPILWLAVEPAFSRSWRGKKTFLDSSSSSFDRPSSSAGIPTSRGELAVCMRPWWGPPDSVNGEFRDVRSLVEFLEMYRLLGVDFFEMFLPFAPGGVSKDVSRILETYVREGVVSLRSLELPSALRPFETIWDFAQIAVIQECVYRLSDSRSVFREYA
uniref:Uncharacterized protein n=1 Tax=Chromera velia CCMP2878 TaxID=1169474 RepID=A0A0G4H019_9ALVE|eukprot:Cvel_5485.t1-p1 / transcript=Cvel_5485.t1 / gene=Cvel_5485 / organism=Chromera_velia_CCMP2878 / gene_product=hypothetical protein / transcript_product=hypothetical protein / location=Cvel_scaffold256:102881-104138(-) / protein_length=304 / sequence_SO=supercontig / SO=protein_coding / is_pseudo=false